MIAKLPKEMEEKIKRLIATGDFDDSEAVLVQAVDELTVRHQSLTRLRALIQEGIDDIEQGRDYVWTLELQHQIREEARVLAASGKPLDPDVCG